ncbi:Uncharacterised protein [Clostridium putrefaciens]|uniref:PqqD family protein n=1 Tax=Clostridium putrefaciens TaxID=99675 RepID=A0A381J633_9CLOT|nr:hypothetical protein [Clostridium putrefaciens]SUY45041.1 Uncharacterised protein [Clostridium putrefaciens]
MNMILYKDANQVYRIRKEDDGCSIFSNSNYIEGDDMTYFIFKKFYELGVSNAINEFIEQFGKKDDIKSDLMDMCEKFRQEHIFLETVASIESYFKEVD